MLRDRFARGRLIAFLALIVLSTGLIAISDTAPVSELRNGIRFAVTPVQDTLGEGTRSLTSVVGAITEVDTLRREKDALAAEVARLSDQVAVIESLEAENRKLTRLLETKDALEGRNAPVKTVAAGVASRQFTQFERMITLDRGSEADIRKDAPVLSEGGALLGRVTAVGEGWADVRLISDPDSLVTGWVKRTDATGAVVGRMSAPLAMTDVPRTEKLSEKDLVVTYGVRLRGGFRSVYPPGIPIGRVVDIIDEPEQVVKTALIVPEADLENIEYALVQTNFRAPRRSNETASE
ncbi:MAG: rod shape-determining protein MreC [Candidatus Limnocylindrales bacterium]